MPTKVLARVNGRNLQVTIPTASNNVTLEAIAAASVPTPPVGSVTTFHDASNGNRLSQKDSTGAVIDLAAAGGGGGAIVTSTSKTAAPANTINLVYDNSIIPPSVGYVTPEGVYSRLQNSGVGTAVYYTVPNIGTNTTTVVGAAISLVGTASSATYATTNNQTRTRKVEYNVTTAATTAAAGLAGASDRIVSGGYIRYYGFWGCTSGGAVATRRGMWGLSPTTTVIADADPLVAINTVAFAWSSANANILLIINDGAGVPTQIDTGIPKFSADRQEMYESEITCYNGVYYSRIKALVSGLTYTSPALTTDIPAAGTLLYRRFQVSVGGTSSLVGAAVGYQYLEFAAGVV